MNQLELKFEKFIQRHHLVTPEQSVLLAVSGGVDSMVMLHLFSRWRERMKLHLSVIHINHQLRGEESMEDESFVREVSAVYSIPYYSERVDVMSRVRDRGLSKQVAARQLRYECFERIRRQLSADVVATAHHADDNAETVLLHIARGTGIHGLAGIPLYREMGCIIRPLLFAPRAEIDAYSTKHGIQYRIDSSNLSLAYRRNLLRHSILPVLQERVPNIVQILNTIADKMRNVNERLRTIVDESLRSLVRKDSQRCLVLDVRKLGREPDFLWDEIFVELLNRMQIEPTEKKVDALHRLCSLPTGRKVELNGELSAYRDRDHIVFRKMSKEPSNIRRVEFGGSYDYNGYRVSISEPESVPTAYAETHESRICRC